MEYELVRTEEYLSALLKLPKKDRDRIDSKIEVLRTNPFVGSSKRVVGSIFRRLRIGDYRVFYDVQGENVQVWIVNILKDHRYRGKLKGIEKRYKRKYL